MRRIASLLCGTAVVLLAATTAGTATAEPKEEPSSGGRVIDTFAGFAEPTNSGDGGPAVEASVAEPNDVALAPDGTLYIATRAPFASSVVRAVDPESGVIRTVVGTGKEGFAGDGGPATKARLGVGLQLAVGPDGTLFLSDQGNGRVRAVDPDDGRIRTVLANLHAPDDVAVGPDGTLYVVDGLDVRAVDPDTKRVTTVVDAEDTDGYDVAGITADRDALYFSVGDRHQVRALDLGKGTVRTVASRGDGPGFAYPDSLAVRDGTLYVSTQDQSRANDPRRSRVYTLDLERGRVAELAGGAPGPALGDGGDPADAHLGNSVLLTKGIDVGEDGRLYIADPANNRVRVVGEGDPEVRPRHSLAGERITTVFGSGRTWTEESRERRYDDESGRFYRDVHDRDEVDLDAPDSVAVAADGTVYVADTGAGRIRVLEPGAAKVRTLAGRPGFSDDEEDREGPAKDAYLTEPSGLALGPEDEELYFVDGTFDEGRVAVVDLAEETVSTVAYHRGDPVDLDVDRRGALYVVAAEPGELCRIDPGKDRCVELAKGRALGDPESVAAGPGVVYVGTAGAYLLAVDPGTGKVSPVAGYERGASGDGGPARSAQLRRPAGLEVAADGTLYIADQGNHRVRAVDPDTGVITTVAGKVTRSEDPNAVGGDYGGGGFSGDGRAAGGAGLDNPSDVALGPDGEVYVADEGNDRVRVVGDVGTSARGGAGPLLLVGAPAALLALLAAGYLEVRRRAGASGRGRGPRRSSPP